MLRPMRPAHRMALFYAALFAGPGVILPFLPLFLATRGLSPADVGIALGASQVGRLVAAPILGRLADSSGQRRRVAIASSLAGALAAGLMLGRGGKAWLIGAVVLLAIANAPLLPIADATALRLGETGEGDFGKLRACGSLSFLIATGLGGVAVGSGGPGLVPWIVLASQLWTVAASAGLPDTGLAAAPGWRGVGALLRRRAFLLLLVASGLIQGSHALYYAFSALHWRAAGHSAATVGALWVLGIAVEILLLTGGRLVFRLGPAGLLASGGLAAVVRWTGTALSDDLLALAFLQPLHAASFAMTMLGAAGVIARTVPPERGATAQSLHASLGPGLATAVLTPFSGVLYGRVGGRSFFAMAAVAAVGLALVAPLARALNRAGTVSTVRPTDTAP